MTYRVGFTEETENDLFRQYECVLTRDESDWALAERALEAIGHGIRSLQLTPFSFRKATSNNPLIPEIVIPFGASGYVALYEIDNDAAHGTTSLLANFTLPPSCCTRRQAAGGRPVTRLNARENAASDS